MDGGFSGRKEHTTVTKVGDTITAVTTPENATNVAKYEWFTASTADATTWSPIAGETDQSLKITSAMENMFIKVIATDDQGKTYESAATTEAVTTTELALKSVEPGAAEVREYDSTIPGWVSKGYNVVIAYFNKEVGDLQAADVQIRRVSDDQLFSVEKVVMSSDKKTATMTLTNSSSAGASVTGLAAITDYKLIVTANGETASKEFYIPGTATDVTILSVDKTKKSINAGAAVAAAVGTPYYVPDTLTVDYDGLVGETATIKFDKNFNVLSLSTLSGEKVVLGAFKMVNESATNYYVQDMLTDTKYYTQSAAAGTILKTVTQTYGNNGAVGAPANLGTQAEFAGEVAIGADPVEYAYGKLVLNSNGTIKDFVRLDKWSGNIYAASVNGNSVISKTGQEQSLDKYIILKDGKSIAVTDIAEGDIVFYNTAYKVAEVYNDVRTGKIEAIYDNAGFKFEGKDRDGSKAAYFKDKAVETVTTNYLKTLGTEKDVTVIFGRNNQPIYVLGEQSAVATSTKTLALTSIGDGFVKETNNVVRLKGFDGSEVVTEDIPVETLESLTVTYPGTYTNANIQGKTLTWKSTNGTFAAAGFGTTKAGETITFKGTATDGATTAAAAGVGTAAQVLAVNTDLAIGGLVSVTKDSKGAVTNVTVKLGTALVAGAGGTKFDSNEKKDFKAGYKNVNTLTIAGSANVYTISNGASSTADPVIALTTYSAFDKVVANANIGQIVYYADAAGKNITDVVIDNRNNAAYSDDTDGSTTSEVVIKDIKYLDEKISGLTVIKNGAETTYSKFGTDSSLKGTFTKGAIISITVLKDGETVSKVAADTTGSTLLDDAYGVQTTAPGALYAASGTTDTDAGKLEKYTFTSDATIVKIADDTVSTISLGDLKTLALTKAVDISLTVAGGDKIDTLVVKTGARADFADALTKLNAGRTGTVYGGAEAVKSADGSCDTTTRYTNLTDAIADLKIVQSDIDDAGLTATKWTGQANGATILTQCEKEQTRAKTYQIVNIVPMTGKVLAVAAADDTKETAAKIAKALPGSIHVTMADGTEKDLTVKFADDVTINNANDVNMGAVAGTTEAQLSWVLANADLHTAGAVATCTVTPVASTATGNPTYAITTAAQAKALTLE